MTLRRQAYAWPLWMAGASARTFARWARLRHVLPWNRASGRIAQSGSPPPAHAGGSNTISSAAPARGSRCRTRRADVSAVTRARHAVCPTVSTLPRARQGYGSSSPTAGLPSGASVRRRTQSTPPLCGRAGGPRSARARRGRCARPRSGSPRPTGRVAPPTHRHRCSSTSPWRTTARRSRSCRRCGTARSTR